MIGAESAPRSDSSARPNNTDVASDMVSTDFTMLGR